MRFKDLIQGIEEMHKQGCSTEYIADILGCSEYLVEQALLLLDCIERHYESSN